MRLAKIVFIVLAVTNYFCDSADDEEPAEPEEKTEPPPLDNHSFLALLNIAFTDGSMHSCTGTIIHDFAVVTAAHCFLSQEDPKEVELTGSFVVIGSKKHFDTGTENYLPMERVIIHPKYKGWAADIALVYTFSEMTSDKGGRIVPIGGEGTTMSSNVTVLSWRRCTDKEGRPIKCPHQKGTTLSDDCNSSENNNDDDENEEYNKRTGTKNPLRLGARDEDPNSEHGSSQYRPVIGYKLAVSPILNFASVITPPTKAHKSGAPNKLHETNAPNKTHETDPLNESSETDAPNESRETNAPDGSETNAPNKSHETEAPNKDQKTNKLKRTDAPDESDAANESFELNTHNQPQEPKTNNKHELERRNKFQETDAPNESNERETILIENDDTPSRRHIFDKNSINMREDKLREVNLTVEIFHFQSIESCKKLVEEALPPAYEISTKESICYSNNHYHISTVDSGAPVINNGRLVALTLGGVKVGEDNMGIGIKLDCYCPWIEKNLPQGNNTLDCCTNCCSREQPVLRNSKYGERTGRPWTATYF